MSLSYRLEVLSKPHPFIYFAARNIECWNIDGTRHTLGFFGFSKAIGSYDITGQLTGDMEFTHGLSSGGIQPFIDLTAASIFAVVAS